VIYKLLISYFHTRCWNFEKLDNFHEKPKLCGLAHFLGKTTNSAAQLKFCRTQKNMVPDRNFALHDGKPIAQIARVLYMHVQDALIW